MITGASQVTVVPFSFLSMKFIYVLLVMLFSTGTHAQELFTYTEPASNMAAKSIGIRINNSFMREASLSRYRYQLSPEIMWGASGKLMVHASAFFSNWKGSFAGDGGALYVKYRFYSQDEVHSHFRMAAFGRFAFNNTHLHQPAIDLNRHNSGYEAGMVATKLINKIALSAGAGFLHAMDNGKYKFTINDKYRNALEYNLSIGKLLLPKEYTSYKQVNLNGMIEFLGQSNLALGNSYVDIASVLQFIILSRMRVDLGYRFSLLNDLKRTASNGFLVRFEYNIFNAYH
jgi:hypothetical protein